MNDLLFATLQVCDGLEIYAGDELSPYLEDRIAQLRSVIAAYDAQAPDWSQAPDWAKWYAIDANGSAAWYKRQPKYDEFCDKWLFGSGSYLHEYHWAGEKDDIAIPLGIDWRLCKWQRPEVAA